MVKKVALLWLSMTTACFGSDDIRRYALVQKQCRKVCAKEFYDLAVAAGRQEDAQIIAQDSFGEDWQTAVLQQGDRASSAHLINSCHNSVWSYHKNNFLRDLVKKHPTMRSWLKEAGEVVPKEIDFQTRMSHKGEVLSRYGSEIERLQGVCAQKYYSQMLADGYATEAQILARNSFGENWQTAIVQPLERHNPLVRIDDPLMRSLVWSEAKNQFVDSMIKQGPPVGNWFFNAFKIDDCFIDSDIEEDAIVEDFRPRSDREIQQEVISEMMEEMRPGLHEMARGIRDVVENAQDAAGVTAQPVNAAAVAEFLEAMVAINLQNVFNSQGATRSPRDGSLRDRSPRND